jgi:hypothetical protein
MEEDKLFNQIKSATENAETKDFPGMEKVWNRVEEKLDNKADKKAVWRWKKIAVAASLLLFATLGYQFLKNNSGSVKPNEVVTTTIDSIKKTSEAPNEIVTAEPSNPIIRKDAGQILQKQIKPETQVAVETDINAENAINITVTPIVSQGQSHSASDTKTEDYTLKTKKAKSNEVEMFLDKTNQVSNTKKEDPLVVIEDKVVKKKLENIEFNEADSLVVLKEPLYIINGKEFTEQEVFGPNPTSPYTPLNKQEIETISILQNEKAIEVYGNKGKKGVVVITTKNAKPISDSAKASKKAK